MEYANLHWHLRQLHRPEDINVPPIIPFSPSESNSSVGTTCRSSSSSDKEEDGADVFCKKGRPKDTSVEQKHEEKNKSTNVTNYIADTFS